MISKLVCFSTNSARFPAAIEKGWGHRVQRRGDESRTLRKQLSGLGMKSVTHSNTSVAGSLPSMVYVLQGFIWAFPLEFSFWPSSFIASWNQVLECDGSAFLALVSKTEIQELGNMKSSLSKVQPSSYSDRASTH